MARVLSRSDVAGMDDKQLAEHLRKVFDDNRDVIETLVIHGWKVELHLPTEGVEGIWEYQPRGLTPRAGFRITRTVSVDDPRWPAKHQERRNAGAHD